MNAHEFLTNEGMYVHTHHEEEWEERGDGETGPMVSHSPAYDEYSGESHYFFAENGVVVWFEPRDIRFEEAMEMCHD